MTVQSKEDDKVRLTFSLQPDKKDKHQEREEDVVPQPLGNPIA